MKRTRMKDKYIFWLETSCDETSVVVLKMTTNSCPMSLPVKSKVTSVLAGWYLSVASRHYVEVITACIEEALRSRDHRRMSQLWLSPTVQA